MSLPLVSIMIPVYNRRELACETIDSALNQTYPNVELIIGDNQSTDGTYEHLTQRYGGKDNVVLFQNRENLGPVGNWMECLKRASGEYVKFLWSDDLIPDCHVEELMQMLLGNPQAGFAYSAIKFFHAAE